MLTIATLLLSAASAHAAPPSIEITSFVYAGRETRAAELCGIVREGGHHSHVRATVDPQTNKPGVYNTFAGPDGRFCMTVVTYTGRALAEVATEREAEAVSTVATAQLSDGR